MRKTATPQTKKGYPVISFDGWQKMDTSYLYECCNLTNKSGVLRTELTEALINLYRAAWAALELEGEQWDEKDEVYNNTLMLTSVRDIFSRSIASVCENGHRENYADTLHLAMDMLTHLPEILRVLTNYDTSKAIIKISYEHGNILLRSLASVAQLSNKDLYDSIKEVTHEAIMYQPSNCITSAALQMPLYHLLDTLAKLDKESIEKNRTTQKRKE